MTDKQSFILVHDTARAGAKQAVDAAPDGYAVIIQEPTRTLEQNSYQWPYLEGFSKQLQWPVNGEKVWMTRDEWKHVLTAAFEKETDPRIAMGIDGGIVMLGSRTSQFGKRKFALWMEYLFAISAIKGVEPVFKNGDMRWTTTEGKP